MLTFSTLRVVEEVASPALRRRFNRDKAVGGHGLKGAGDNLAGLVGKLGADLPEFGHMQVTQRATPEGRGNIERAALADGTQICWKRVGTTSVISASGPIFLSNAVGSGSYPMAFVSLPTVSAMACVSGYQWALWAANAAEPTATTWGSYYAVAGASTAQGAFINIIAAGRWY